MSIPAMLSVLFGITSEMLELNTIYNESCLDTLARMPDESVDLCITSPPYYGLRSYGTDPQVWGNHNGCSHTWGESIKYAKEDKRTPEQKAAQGAVVGNSVNSIGFAVGNSGAFCLDCNAWRGELGLEPTFQLYISHLIDIFREVKRVLKPTGTCWVNLGDSYGTNSGCARQYQRGVDKQYGKIAHQEHGNGFVEKDKSLHKSLMNIPARFAIAMTDELGFIQRNEIIWHKPACMPSSAKDRFTVDFESIFFFTKSAKYWFEQQTEPVESKWEATHYKYYRDKGTAVANTNHDRPDLGVAGGRFVGGEGRWSDRRNMRTVWRVNFEPQPEEHYASYPTKLIEIPIKAGCPPGGIVFDPFFGTGTTGIVAYKLGRKFIGSELQPKYAEIANKRLEPYLAQSTLFDG